jgi:epoxyqueuosine reductase
MKKESLFSADLLDNLNIVSWGATDLAEPKSFEQFTNWVDRKDYVPLNYLADERADKRGSVKNIFPEFKSAFVFLFSYADISKALNKFYDSEGSNGLKIGSYVLGFEGADYHMVLLQRLEEIKAELLKSFPDANFKHSLDIQPVLERDLAHRAGLGWFGKNSMLINKEYGSFFIIGSLLTDIELPQSFLGSIDTDHCGNCTECIDLCPTDAIDPVHRTLISNKCISTYTIEVFHPDRMSPPEKMEAAKGEFYGCDICQDVCPWNKKFLNSLEPKTIHELLNEEQRAVLNFFLEQPLDELHKELSSMSNKQFEKRFKLTPLARTRRVGVLKNIEFWLKLKSDL